MSTLWGSLEIFASVTSIMCCTSGSLLLLLEFFVDSRLDVTESVGNAGQTFCMADKKCAPGGQQVRITIDEHLLGRFVKIDHDVAAKDDVEMSTHGPRVYEVQAGEVNEVADVLVDTVESLGARLNSLEIL